MLDSTKRAAHVAAYSLIDPLPSEALRSSVVLGDYRNYPVFSLPWFRGRYDSLLDAGHGTR
jgi:hypothetical protein